MYRQRGKEGCSLPAIRTCEVDQVLAGLFSELVTEKTQIIRLVLDSIASAVQGVDYEAQIGRIERQIVQIREKKEKLLELSMENAVTLQEFKERNEQWNCKLSALEEQQLALRRQQERSGTDLDPAVLEKVLWEELNFTNGVHSEVVAAILDHIEVLEQSADKQIYLEIYLRLGQRASAHFQRGGLALCNRPLKNTIPPMGTRTT